MRTALLPYLRAALVLALAMLLASACAEDVEPLPYTNGAHDGPDAAGDDDADPHSDEHDADVGVDDDVEDDPEELDPPDPQPLGAFCNDELPCEEDLTCYRELNLEADGFCTRRCEVPGTGCGYVGPDLYLKCTLSDEEGPLCGFICYLDHGDHGHTYSCPSGDWGRLRCQMSQGPGGHRYCAPR